MTNRGFNFIFNKVIQYAEIAETAVLDATDRMPQEDLAVAKKSKVGLMNDETVAVCKTACAANGSYDISASGMRTGRLVCA